MCLSCFFQVTCFVAGVQLFILRITSYVIIQQRHISESLHVLTKSHLSNAKQQNISQWHNGGAWRCYITQYVWILIHGHRFKFGLSQKLFKRMAIQQTVSNLLTVLE